MATTVATLQARLDADTRPFDSKMRSSDSTFSKIGRNIGRVALLAGTAVATGFAIGAVKSVKAASDLNEEINKTRVVFGQSGKAILAWSEETSHALGLSRRAALQGAGSIGAMLRPMGFVPKLAADMSKKMVILASDMASFNNEDPSEMLDRIRAGLSGESEPLKRFGTVLSETRVKQFAWKTGLVETGKELTEQQKVQARYNLLLKDTALQQGDFERTSGGMANQLRILKAEVQDASAQIGVSLLPVITEVLHGITFLIPVVSRLGNSLMEHLRPAFRRVAQIVETHWPRVQEILAGIWAFVVSTLVPAFQDMRQQLTSVVRRVAAVFVAHKADLTDIWESVKSIVGDVYAVFKNQILPLLKKTLPVAIDIAIPIIRDLFNVLARVASWANSAASGIERLVRAVRSIPGGGSGLISQIQGAVGAIEGVAEHLPGGNRQHGGFVSARRSYIVGEAGPELFVPRMSGTIIPNNRLAAAGGGGATIILNANVVGGRDAVIQWVAEGLRLYERRNGRPAF